MSTLFTNIIHPEQLQPIYPECIILDCRSKLGDPSWGLTQFVNGHLACAQHASLDNNLASAASAQGRHPLPLKETWLHTIRRWGVNNQQQVVVYDDAGGAYAARAWWMFRWVGHENVAVLDGGISSWTESLHNGPGGSPTPSNFAAGVELTKTISAAELLRRLHTLQGHLVDARTTQRFHGEQEPIDPIPGHIPGAVCYPLQGNLNQHQRFLDSQALAARFSTLKNLDEIISYCGSGVTACHNILAMNIAGFPEPKLFVDSWSGWITNTDNPIATR
ncbi:MAG: sulfurtransferase [Gammaproteobacteria bacterium]|nr:sulfurtransferase [Gammaproteobacteria bacterium]